MLAAPAVVYEVVSTIIAAVLHVARSTPRSVRARRKAAAFLCAPDLAARFPDLVHHRRRLLQLILSLLVVLFFDLHGLLLRFCALHLLADRQLCIHVSDFDLVLLLGGRLGHRESLLSAFVSHDCIAMFTASTILDER